METTELDKRLITYQELLDYIKDNKIKSVISFGKVFRLFVYNKDKEGECICYYKKGSNRRGCYFYESYFNSITKINYKKDITEPEDTEYKTIAKFRKQALKATFTNDFIRQCLALPSTKEQWITGGKKKAYEYSITTGGQITGQLVSVDCICKKLNRYSADDLREAIKNRSVYHSPTFNFNGYDGSVALEYKEGVGWRGFLSKEYRNCGNGYYYLLINDEYFIGYDKD